MRLRDAQPSSRPADRAGGSVHHAEQLVVFLSVKSSRLILASASGVHSVAPRCVPSRDQLIIYLLLSIFIDP